MSPDVDRRHEPEAVEDGLGRVVRQSGMYAFGNMMLKGIGFVLTFLYVHQEWLDKAGFGSWGLLEALVKFAVLIGGLGLSTGLMKCLSDDAYRQDHEALPFTGLVTSLGAALGLFAVFWACAPWLGWWLLDDAGLAWLVRWTGVYAALKILGDPPLMVLRAREQAGWYAFVKNAEAVLLVVGVVYFLGMRDLGLAGVVYAYVGSAAVTVAVQLAYLGTQIPWTFRPALVKPMLRVGFALILAALGSQFLNIGDRFLLKSLTTIEVVAVYEMAAKISGVFNMLFVQSFQLAFAVIGVKVLADEAEGRKLYRRTFRHYAIWAGWGVLGLALLAHDLIRFMDPAYLEADLMVFPYALGFFWYGFFYIFMNLLFALERTKSIARMVAMAAVVNAGLNLALIPVLGGLGAALATLFSYGILAALTWRAAQSLLAVQYPWAVLWKVLALVAGLYALGVVSTDWSTGGRLLFRAGLIVAYPIGIVLLNAYTREDWNATRRFMQRFGARWFT